jgi:hypothetical protein
MALGGLRRGRLPYAAYPIDLLRIMGMSLSPSLLAELSIIYRQFQWKYGQREGRVVA